MSESNAPPLQFEVPGNCVVGPAHLHMHVLVWVSQSWRTNVRIGITVILWLVCVAASAADRSEKVHDLMEAQGLVQMFEQQLHAGREQTQRQAELTLEKMLSTLNPPAEFQAKLRAASSDFVKAALPPWTAKDIVEVWGKYYGSKFSDEELDELLSYYRSPLGQKDVLASRDALGPYTAEFQERYKPILEKATQEFAERLQVTVKECNCKKKGPTDH
jgi:hypothetical protein